MEVYNAEIHAVKEGLSAFRTVSQLVPTRYIYLYGNSAPISALSDYPNRVRRATGACELELALVHSG
jgi:hypothetical protein